MTGVGLILRRLRDRPTRDLDLMAGTVFTVLVRIGSYGMVAVAGVVMARALGAHDRGVYSLVTTIALMFAAFAELGISKAGIYFVSKERFPLQAIISNNLAWLLTVGTIWVAITMTIAVVRPAFIPDTLQFQQFVIFAIGGTLLLFLILAEDLLISSGSVLSYNLIRLTETSLRAGLVIGGVALFGLGIVGVLSAWLLAIILTSVLAVYLITRWASPIPRVQIVALRAQMSYGIRANLGFILQSVNHRLDVFLVAAIAGQTALGHYAVAFGIAELLWRMPFALGAVFFPKVATLDPETNAETAATTLRRALFIVLLATLAILPLGRILIGSVYGAEFLPGLTAFYILAPSALFYTIFRVLSASLAASGMPEASIYAGAASVPVSVGLGLLLIPKMGIEGAAIASMAAYIVAAGVVLAIFLSRTHRSLVDTLLINRLDITSSVQAAKGLLARGAA